MGFRRKSKLVAVLISKDDSEAKSFIVFGVSKEKTWVLSLGQDFVGWFESLCFGVYIEENSFTGVNC